MGAIFRVLLLFLISSFYSILKQRKHFVYGRRWVLDAREVKLAGQGCGHRAGHSNTPVHSTDGVNGSFSSCLPGCDNCPTGCNHHRGRRLTREPQGQRGCAGGGAHGCARGLGLLPAIRGRHGVCGHAGGCSIWVCMVLRARTGVLGAHVNRAFCQPFAGGTVFVGMQVGAHECLWARTWVFVGWQAGVCGRAGGCKDEGLQVPPTCAKAALALVLGPKNGDHRSHHVAHRWSPMGDVSVACVPPLWTSIASSTPPLALNSWGTRRTLPAPTTTTPQPPDARRGCTRSN